MSPNSTRVQIPCPAGRYGSTLSLSTPDCSGPCAPGYECPVGSTIDTARSCPPGYYCSGGDRVPCPPGRYSAANGTTSAATCSACPAGRYSNASAATAAATCAACGGGEGSVAGDAECWPAVVSAVAFNPIPVVAGLSAGDVVVVTFTRGVNTSVDVAAAVEFTPAIGTVAYRWRGDTVLEVTVLVPPSGVSALTDAPDWSVTVSGFSSASGVSSPMQPQSVQLTGSWGSTTAPVLTSAVAADTGRNAGLWSRDTLTLTFDQPVTHVAVDSPASVASLVRFSPSMAEYCPGGNVTAAWQGGAAVVVSFAFPLSASPPTDQARWGVGALVVTVVGLHSAFGTSPPSNTSLMVTNGRYVTSLARAPCYLLQLAPRPSTVSS